jgi:hypothetical protein
MGAVGRVKQLLYRLAVSPVLLAYTGSEHVVLSLTVAATRCVPAKFGLLQIFQKCSVAMKISRGLDTFNSPTYGFCASYFLVHQSVQQLSTVEAACKNYTWQFDVG